ncbi:MAG: flagellar M-ring protein FliF [Ruminiclostridium sp.]|nr:flagellar M-ring protein FliF [Ruminiclostridium sp.]
MDKVKEILGKLTAAIKARWGAFNKTVRIIIIAVASVIVVSLITLIIINSITRYAVLYTGATESEITEIITVLENNLGVAEADVRVNVATGEIMVPANRVENLRAQLAVQGYPKQTFNYNIWDEGVGLFSTESDKREKQKQQLQENLRATLSMIDGIHSAIVILNIPETQNYVISDERDEASASVMLQLDHALSVEAVEGVYNLVRRSVRGLKEENITVTDSAGVVLTSETVVNNLDSEDEVVLFYRRLDFQNKIAKILDEKLGELFGGAFNDYRVAVDVQLNYDPTVKQITEYTPSVESEGTKGGMIQDEEYVSAGGGNADEGGLVGTTVDSDISPDYPTLRIGDGDEFYYETQKKIHYLVNEEITQIEKDGYSYDNISASVVVDDDAEKFNEAERERWEKFIATAIGTSVEKVSFMAMNFKLEKTEGSAGDGGVVVSGSRNTLVFIIIALGVLLIALLVVALLAAGSNKKRIKARKAAAVAAAAGHAPAVAGSIAYDEEDMGKRTVVSQDEDFDYEIQKLSGADDETSRDALLKKEIRDFSTSNPEIVAQLIRTWMKGEEQ